MCKNVQNMKPVQNVQSMKPVQYAQVSYFAHFRDYFFLIFFFFWGGGWGWVEVILEDFISETVYTE